MNGSRVMKPSFLHPFIHKTNRKLYIKVKTKKKKQALWRAEFGGAEEIEEKDPV